MCVVCRCWKCRLVAKVRRWFDRSQRHNAMIPHMHHGGGGVVGWRGRRRNTPQRFIAITFPSLLGEGMVRYGK